MRVSDLQRLSDGLMSGGKLVSASNAGAGCSFIFTMLHFKGKKQNLLPSCVDV